jgi:hypothetical protein
MPITPTLPSSGGVSEASLASTLTTYAPRAWCMAQFATPAMITASLTGYATTSSMSSALSSYATTASLNTAISNCVSNSALTSALSGYVTSGALSSYVTNTSLTASLQPYALISSLSQFATAASLSNYATTASLSSYATTSSLSGYATTSSLSTYATADALSGKYSIPTGTTSQYIRGDGTLATFPTLFNGTYASLTGKPALATVATSGSYVDLLNKPTIPAGFLLAVPTTRVVTLATAYQATDITKASFVTINITATSSVSLSGTSNNEGGVWIGATNAVATGTGSQVGAYKNALGGTLVVGLTVTSAQTQPYSFMLPAGWFWAVRQTVGTGMSIVSTFEQALS